jgi:hypothetical protein
MKTVKKVITATLLLTALIPMFTLYPTPKKSQSFCQEAISAELPYHPEWDSRPLNAQEEQEVLKAISQPYRYLGSGGQCYSFVSEDDQYVIKFFKQKAFALPLWIKRCPLSFLVQSLKDKKTLKKEKQRGKVFAAFKLSLDHLPQETGMLYVHLNRTSHLNKTLSLCDAAGVFHTLHLDDLEFIVQKKAQLAFARIDSLMQSGDTEGAKQAINKLLQLNLELYRKGVRNRDPNFRSNCGFIGSKAIVIDVGRMVCSEEMKDLKRFKLDLLRSTPRFRKYLAKNHPQLLSYFDTSVEQIVCTPLPPESHPNVIQK